MTTFATEYIASRQEVAQKPLRILIVMNMLWSREMGAPRVSIEIAEELEAMGHHVDHFDIRSAFPRDGKLSSYFHLARFPAKAIKFVRANAAKYDVIQAEQGDLPVFKNKLNFRGRLIVRSNGLAHFYEEYAARVAARDRQREIRRGTLIGNALRWTARQMHGGLKNVEKGFDAADAIVMINHDERDFVERRLGHGGKVHLLPCGLSDERLAEFDAACANSREARLRAQRVVFIGRWSERKGSDDIGAIVHRVRSHNSAARFLLLGTGVPDETVIGRFAEEDRPFVEVVRHYRSHDLPRLIATSTLAILPSYIEGFPIGILEACAAGMPTVAYDVPGSREVLKQFDVPLLTPPGDVNGFADRMTDLLALELEPYAAICAQARELGGRYRWKQIARQMLAIYRGDGPESFD